MRCACIFFRCRVLPYGVDGAWAACTRAVLWGSRAVTARAFWCSPSRCDASALWLVPRARRSAAKAVHCLRVASSAAANRDHRATTKPRTTRRRRPGRLQPSPYGLFKRTRASNPNGVLTRSAASPPDAPQHAWEQKKLPASSSAPPDALAAAAAREIIVASRKLLDHTSHRGQPQ